MTLIASKEFASVTVDLNVGYRLAEQRADHWDGFWHYGLAVRRELCAGLWGVGEGFAVTPAEHHPTSVAAQIGFQRQVAPDLTVDAAIGTGLRRGPDATATLGLTWVF